MNYQLTADQVLVCLIGILKTNLSELVKEGYKNEFIVGEWYAYIECLEFLFSWKKAEKFGLNFDPESRYSLI